MIQLRDYQQSLVKQASELMRSGERRILLQSPTGSGKTALTAHMLLTCYQRGMRGLFVVHRRELVKQSLTTFEKFGVPCGTIAAGFEENLNEPIQVAMVQTLTRRLTRLEAPHLIVWDECHHIAAGMWTKVFEAYPNAFHIGLTATPERLDGKGLFPHFTNMINGPTVKQLIDQNWLSNYKAYAPVGFSVEGIKTRMGDYAIDQVEERVNTAVITGSAIAEYKRYAAGKRNVIFASTIAHSKDVVAKFNSCDISALHVDGNDTTEYRDEAIRKFQTGEVKVLSNVDLFGEGFDLPEIECVTLLRPTKSVGRYLQMVGRALRPADGKSHAIILDHVRNIQEHGLPCADRSWSLQGRPKGTKGDSGLSVKVCQTCFAVNSSVAEFCMECENKFPKKLLKPTKQIEGDLVEIEKHPYKHLPAMERKTIAKQLSKKANSLKEVERIAELCGYKRQWAFHYWHLIQTWRKRGVW